MDSLRKFAAFVSEACRRVQGATRVRWRCASLLEINPSTKRFCAMHDSDAVLCAKESTATFAPPVSFVGGANEAQPEPFRLKKPSPDSAGGEAASAGLLSAKV